MRKIRSICQDCHCECGLLVSIENGRITKIEGDPQHPMNKGYVCIKGLAQPQVAYHPDRLRFPLKRINDKWERISWDQALGEIAAKLTEIRARFGPLSISTLHGTGPRPSLFSTALLAYALGSPNVISTNAHICFVPTLVAEICTVGTEVTQEVGPDYENTNCVFVWGGNPLNTHPPRGLEILQAKRKRGAKLIVVDPRRTLLASEADLWLQIRPGTDGALALGILNIILKEKLYDKEFVEKWCHGFDELAERVKDYPLERVSEITGIPPAKIEEAARTYASTKPAVMHTRVALEHNINSVQTIRSLIIMVALTGNIDVKGGNLLQMRFDGFATLGKLFGGAEFRPDAEVEEKRLGSRSFPLVSGHKALAMPFVHPSLAVKSILEGEPYPTKAMYCAGGNPIVTITDSKEVWEALSKLELFVVADFFMTPTAELAHYVLPATTWVERDEICDMMYTNYISARQRVIDPVGECWDDLKIVIELVKRLPWANKKFVPWHDVDEFNEWRLKETGTTFEELKKMGTLVKPMKYKKYEDNGFNTPSKKVELYSSILKENGYDPLPGYKEPPESPLSTPELLKDYPLILITGARYIEYYHSEGRQIPSLRKRVPDPEIEIHPDLAKEIKIQDGDWIWIETPQVRGERAKMKAKITRTIDPRVVHARHGWWFPEKPGPEHGCFDSNINVTLSDDSSRDPICGSVPLDGTLCKIYK